MHGSEVAVGGAIPPPTITCDSFLLNRVLSSIRGTQGEEVGLATNVL